MHPNANWHQVVGRTHEIRLKSLLGHFLWHRAPAQTNAQGMVLSKVAVWASLSRTAGEVLDREQ